MDTQKYTVSKNWLATKVTNHPAISIIKKASKGTIRVSIKALSSTLLLTILNIFF